MLGPDASPCGSRRPLEEALTALRKVRGSGQRWSYGVVLAAVHVPVAPCAQLTSSGWSALQGALLLKHGRHGKPKVHYFRVTACDTLLRWRSASGSLKQVGAGRRVAVGAALRAQVVLPLISSIGCIVGPVMWSCCTHSISCPAPCRACTQVKLRSVGEVAAGQATEVFRRHPLREPARSFSLLYTDEDGSSRTLDLTCADEQQYDLWYGGLAALVRYLRTLGAPVAGAAAAAGTATAPASGSKASTLPSEVARWLQESRMLQVRVVSRVWMCSRVWMRICACTTATFQLQKNSTS